MPDGTDDCNCVVKVTMNICESVTNHVSVIMINVRPLMYSPGVAEQAQTWGGGATFEFSFTMLSRRRFAAPRSHLCTNVFQASDIIASLQLICPRHPKDHPPSLYRILV